MTSATVLQWKTLVVGVDGCHSGSIAFARGTDGPEYRLVATFIELLQASPCPASGFVDMPIDRVAFQVKPNEALRHRGASLARALQDGQRVLPALY